MTAKRKPAKKRKPAVPPITLKRILKAFLELKDATSIRLMEMDLAVSRMAKSVDSVMDRVGNVTADIRTGLRDVHAAFNSLPDRFIQKQREQLAMFACWSRIDSDEAQRLMSIQGGDMTPLYADWYISTHTKEEAMANYKDRLSHLPPYLRDKLNGK